ncbi:hypothetical protein MKEN_01148100 [Mycena kentingensis (nom. inval.)]|nr:hypothetical protein MKEN_01148100 [Mycena kentingensis (nom. inval.)]
MSTDDTIRQNAAYHATLLSSIAALDYVPSALQHQCRLVGNLQQQLRDTDAAIKSLEKKTKKERKEHESIRDSTARRLAAKLTGRKEKFEKKQEKEEREYVEALEKEMQEKSKKTSLETMISEASGVQRDLEDKNKQYEKTKADLAGLYSRIFDGPTQAYPEDDRLEGELNQALGVYNDVQGQLNAESQAVKLLTAANGALDGCRRSISEALSYSTYDMFGGDGFADLMERNALSEAQRKASQAAMLVQQAQHASPHVQPIGHISIAQGSIITDVVFDNIFTDMMFHDKIKASQRNLEAVQLNAKNELLRATARTQVIGGDLNGAADRLARARSALDGFRRSVFDSAVPHAAPGTFSAPSGPPPPEYGARAPDNGPPAANYTAPAGPPPAASYTPPSGPPPSWPQAETAPAPPSKDAPAAPEVYMPPSGPPPSDVSLSASPTSTWGSRNPYAAALVASEKPTQPEKDV